MLKRNAFMRLRFTQPPQLDLLLEGKSFEVRDHDVIRAIVYAENPIEEKSLLEKLDASTDHGTSHVELLKELVTAQILVSDNYRHRLQDAAEHWQRRGWLDALVLHLRSRSLDYADFGATQFKSIAPSEQPRNDPIPDSSMASDTGVWIELPACKRGMHGGADLLQVMRSRRSGEAWTTNVMSTEMLARILQAGNLESLRNREEIAHSSRPEQTLFDRSSYSALETYVICNKIDGIEAGVYRYEIATGRMHQIANGDFSSKLVEMCIGQGKVRGCACALLIAAHWQRYYMRYRHPRAYRNLLINTAELAHYYILAATAAGLSNFITPAFNDAVAASLIGQKTTSMGPLYMVAIG